MRYQIATITKRSHHSDLSHSFDLAAALVWVSKINNQCVIMQESTVKVFECLFGATILLGEALSSLENANRKEPSKENEHLVTSVKNSTSKVTTHIGTLAESEGIDIWDTKKGPSPKPLDGITDAESEYIASWDINKTIPINRLAVIIDVVSIIRQYTPNLGRISTVTTITAQDSRIKAANKLRETCNLLIDASEIISGNNSSDYQKSLSKLLLETQAQISDYLKDLDNLNKYLKATSEE